jgi:PAS domain S-box-containing protein
MGKAAVVIFTRDINERKVIEESLRSSKETFKKLYDKAPIPYHTLSPKGIITNVNEKWCKTLKYTRSEAINKSIFDFVVEGEKKEAKSSFEKKILEGKSYAGGHERAYVTKNNEERIFVIHDYLLFDKNENVISVHTTMEDITQRRQLWDNIVKSEEKYRVLAETSADGVLTTDVLGRLTYVNPSLEKILGRRKSKILATPFKNYLSESTVFLYQQAFLDVRKKSKKMENISLDILHNDGYEIPIEVNISPLKKDGKFMGIECTIRDVSERKKIERELKRSEKLRTEFMNIAAHELKSPITPIKGYLELIESSKDSNEKIKNWARIGMRNADRLMRLVNDILDVSRLDTNTMRFNMEKLDIKEILENAAEDVKPDIANKNLKLIKEIPKELPMILCDNYRLSQVLKNLLGNAIKFTDYGSISLKAEKKENKLIIYVEDTGIGISSDETKKIFTKFYQAYTGEDRKNEGTGLGLFICKEILKKHNGDIWAESKVGKGSKFIIEIPF